MTTTPHGASFETTFSGQNTSGDDAIVTHAAYCLSTCGSMSTTATTIENVYRFIGVRVIESDPMYVPTHFEPKNLGELYEVIEQHPLGALVVHGPNGLDANHLPFELVREAGGPGVLRAHVARANPLWNEVANGDEVLVIFRAMDAYISPNWYPSKHETHRQVPTWNYQVVHAHGRITIHDDEKFVRGVVARLTRTHESRLDGHDPWRMSDAPKDFIDELLKAIVGIEIEIVKLVGKCKLGQNREQRDRLHAAQQLEARGDETIARAMRESV